MAVVRRILLLTGALCLGAMLSGGVAAQDSGSVLHEIAAAGRAADLAEARAATPSSERRAAAAPQPRVPRVPQRRDAARV